MEGLYPQSQEDIIENPHKYGFPSFDEFKRNPEQWLGRDDESLAQADVGSTILNKTVRRHIYEVEGYRCKSLEEVERVAASQGIPLRELDYRPVLQQAGAGKYEIVVRFMKKSEIARRNVKNGRR
jgi:hypothetical protein